MVGKATRRLKMKGSRKRRSVLKVDMASKIGSLERLLHNGRLTVVLIYADWCGACTRFKRDIWGPMSRRPALHNRVAVREDLIKNTSLAGTNYKYLPTIMMVNEKGEPEAVDGPEGRTNAIPTPKSPEDMSKIVNAKVLPAVADATPEPMTVNKSALPAGNLFKPSATARVYTPLNDTVSDITPKAPQRGGALFHVLQEASRGSLPAALTAAYQRSLA